jgi:hypothetical protein
MDLWSVAVDVHFVRVGELTVWSPSTSDGLEVHPTTVIDLPILRGRFSIHSVCRSEVHFQDVQQAWESKPSEARKLKCCKPGKKHPTHNVR